MYAPILGLPPSRRSPLVKLRSTLTDAAMPGVYAPSINGLRLVGASTVGVVDDVRVGTSTGRVALPGVANESVTIGNVTELNAATKVSVSVWFTPNTVGGTQALFSRANNSLAGNQLLCYIDSTAKLYMLATDGAALAVASGGTTIVPGTTYKATFVYDGTLAAASRPAIYLSTFNPATQTWSTDAAEAMTLSGAAWPAALATFANRTAYLGMTETAAFPMAGQIDEARVWVGAALTLTQIRAEALTANPVAASLRYAFYGTATNSGTLGSTYDGTLSANVVYCSDDLRYGPPLWSVGTARPTYANGVVTFDGVDDYLRSVGAFGITAANGAAWIGTVPPTAAAEKALWETSIGAAPAVDGVRRKVTNGPVYNASSVTAQVPAVSPLSVYHARRAAAAGGNVMYGMQQGVSAEVTQVLAGADATPNMLTLGANRGPGQFSDCTMAAFALYKGTYDAARASAVNAFAASLGATL